MIRSKLPHVGTTIFTVMTNRARELNAINLAQGFPDFDPPPELLAAAHEAIKAGHHQYPPSTGVPALRQAVAAHAARRGLGYDPDTEVTVTVGATEAIVCTIEALTEPGDEVVIIDPAYDLYAPAVAAAGCVARRVTTTFPDFRIDEDRLVAACGPRTSLIVLNTPWNPTGRVISEAELRAIGEVAERFDAYVLSDEAYEDVVFDAHRPVAATAGCRDRTVTVSSVSKTLSATGWRVGWAMAPAPLTAAIRAVHQFVTFAAPAPLQHAVGAMLAAADDAYYATLRQEYALRRDTLLAYLHKTGLEILAPEGTYFVLTRCPGDDVEYCTDLVTHAGVAAIPASVFYADRAAGRGLVRFAFCKRLETLHRAGERLVRYSGSE